MSRRMKMPSRVLVSLIPLVFASCTIEERPSDLKLDQVYVADISKYSHRTRDELKGTQKFRLVIELSTSDVFFTGALVVDGFCGEKQSPGYLGDGGFLHRITDSDGQSGSGGTLNERPARHRFFILVPLVYMPDRPYPEFQHYDLRDDGRDICLTTGAGTYADVWKSNEVRVPRSLIDKALRDAPRQDIPLSGT
jgi:hypothetical protein